MCFKNKIYTSYVLISNFIFSFHMNVLLTLGFQDIIVSNFVTLTIFGTIFYMDMKQMYNN
jgi:hypothetical protein